MDPVSYACCPIVEFVVSDWQNAMQKVGTVESRFLSFVSIRWRTLLDFNCRNRLLLTGTPIQNTMAEVGALVFGQEHALFHVRWKTTRVWKLFRKLRCYQKSTRPIQERFKLWEAPSGVAVCRHPPINALERFVGLGESWEWNEFNLYCEAMVVLYASAISTPLQINN